MHFRANRNIRVQFKITDSVSQNFTVQTNSIQSKNLQPISYKIFQNFKMLSNQINYKDEQVGEFGPVKTQEFLKLQYTECDWFQFVRDNDC